jgi:hypothetical protein
MIPKSHIVDERREVDGPGMAAAVRDVDFRLALFRAIKIVVCEKRRWRCVSLWLLLWLPPCFLSPVALASRAIVAPRNRLPAMSRLLATSASNIAGRQIYVAAMTAWFPGGYHAVYCGIGISEL